MITAKELRIGNLVYAPSGNVISVTATWIKEQAQCDLSNCEYLKPIPITVERLLKFGFIKFLKTDIYQLNDTKVEIIGDNKHGFGFNHGERLLKRISYIHTLQNLVFFLEDKELEINGN
jgi:hypothetical protein